MVAVLGEKKPMCWGRRLKTLRWRAVFVGYSDIYAVFHCGGSNHELVSISSWTSHRVDVLRES
jgi:hypothetical protein